MARSEWSAGRSGVADLLRDRVSGDVIDQGAEEYDKARAVWNGMIDRRPVAVVRPRSVGEVQAAVETARDSGLPLAVRGGAHNVAGLATIEGGIVLDLSLMRDIHVDPQRRQASVQAGAIWRDVDAATQRFGLAAPAGLISETGVAGLTLSGGIGWLRRKHGLTCDNLIGAELVAADGRVVRTDLDEHPELLWALRGGGGNFGVVTSFTFALHEVGPDVAYLFVFYDGAESAKLLRAFRELGREAPPEMAPIAFTGVTAALPGVPEEVVGRPMLAIAGMYAGPPDEGEERLRPLRTLARPLADLSGRAPYVEVQQLLDEDYPRGRRYYWKSASVAELSDDVIDIVVEHSARMPSPLGTIDVWLLGGAMKSEPPGGAAWTGRHAGYQVNPEANWENAAGDAANLRWARDLIAALEPHTVGTYLNFPGLLEEGQEQIRRAFGANYDRLVEIKRHWDPDNLFRANQNIDPGPRSRVSRVA
jgi:FAD/FMN-containing dehydrogenase